MTDRIVLAWFIWQGLSSGCRRACRILSYQYRGWKLDPLVSLISRHVWHGYVRVTAETADLLCSSRVVHHAEHADVSARMYDKFSIRVEAGVVHYKCVNKLEATAGASGCSPGAWYSRPVHCMALRTFSRMCIQGCGCTSCEDMQEKVQLMRMPAPWDVRNNSAKIWSHRRS